MRFDSWEIFTSATGSLYHLPFSGHSTLPSTAIDIAFPTRWSIRGRCQIDAFMHEAEEHLQRFFATKSISDIAGEVVKKAPTRFLTNTAKWFDERQSGRRKKG